MKNHGLQLLNNLNRIQIKIETPVNVEAISQLNREAFGREDEPNLLKLLRERDELLVSLVALDGDTIVGHVCASRVKIDGVDRTVAGIGPLAVIESHRCQGIGSMLMEAIIKQLRIDGFVAAVLLGNPNYYPRFGFSSGISFGLQNEYGVDESFMAMELVEGSLQNISGIVKYTNTFTECGC